MIYEFPEQAAPIRQGDIFIGLPRVDFSLEQVLLAHESGEEIIDWKEIAYKKESVDVIVPVRPVSSIVITQDCDAIRSRDITLCEIREFRDVEKKSKNTSSPKSWKNILTQHARINQKWFYLPPSEELEFSEKMAVDFPVTIRVSREELENFRSLRRGRINDISNEHFRERISEFFRRYPYDEWYALDEEEMAAYRKEYPDVEPFKWQMNKERTHK